DDNRPIFMHMAAIAFHYGPEVAASQRSWLWFKGLGAQSIRGPAGAMRFLDDVWIPQMTDFVSRQALRLIGQQDADRRELLENQDQQQRMVEAWLKIKNRFTWSNYHPIYQLAASQSTGGVTSKTRREFARELSQSCTSKSSHAFQPYCSQHATWFSILRAAFQHTDACDVTKDQWVGAMATTMLSNEIECLPAPARYA
ncbi:hypothetical protein F5884DRAFT_687983, partial [Xylogone sp. PMI_703]